jgi:hypothetical protein
LQEDAEEETKSKMVDFELPSIPDIEDDEPDAPAGYALACLPAAS